MSRRPSPFTKTLFGVLLLPLFLGADQVTLKNGDRITGKIVKKDGATLTINSDLFGTVTMPWAQVDSATADNPLTILTNDSKTLQGTATTTNGVVQIGGASVALADVAAIRGGDEQKAYERLQHPGWKNLWAGTATLGFAGTAGNAITQSLTTGLKAARVTNTDKTSVSFEAIKASETTAGKNAVTAEAVRGGIAYDHNLRPRLFATVFNEYEFDKFENLDLRYVLGGGLGFHAVKGKKSQLDLVAGLDYTHAKFSTPLIQKTGEGFFGDDYAFKFLTNASLVQTARFFDSFQDGSNYRANFDLGASFKVAKWLNWNLNFSDRFLNEPAPGRKRNDILYTTGIGVIFAR